MIPETYLLKLKGNLEGRDMSIFKKEKKCQSVKIWSRTDMDDLMMLFGWTVFNEYNCSLTKGEVSAKDGCVYSNDFYVAYAKKTTGGMCSVCVSHNAH